MTVTRPEDTRKKWRIVYLQNKSYAVQRKFLFWWIYEKTTLPNDIGNCDDTVILNFDKLKTAEQHIQNRCRKSIKQDNVICHYNDEGIQV